MKLYYAFVEDESGATAIEYALLIALISIAMISGATSMTVALQSKYSSINNATAG